MATVLIIDDDPSFADLVAGWAREQGYVAATARNLAQGLERASRIGPTAVLLDVRLPDGSGLDVIQAVRRGPSHPEVVVATGEGDADDAERAIRAGAFDYVQKGASVAELGDYLETAIVAHASREKAGRSHLDLGPIRATSSAMRDALDGVARAAESDVDVLVVGETGTGKELFAHAIHANGARRGGPFVVVDCAALPPSLVESTLFGHRKGAFTGATEDRPGLVRMAHGGTLFLDELGELPLTVQAALLRVVQERTVRPVGGGAEVPSDFRLVAATNRELDLEVREGRFRADLLFRVRGLEIALPPLRERREDIAVIAESTVASASARWGLPRPELSAAFLAALTAYSWPGNVRELVHATEASLAAAAGQKTLLTAHLPTQLRIHAARSALPQRAVVAAGPLPTLETALDATREEYLRTLLTRVGGDIAAACRTSGLSRSSLYSHLRRFGIARDTVM